MQTFIPGTLSASDDFCHHLALCRCSVGQHRFSRHVSNGVDTAHRSAALVIDTDERSIQIEINSFKSPAIGCRLTADCNQDPVGRERYGLPIRRGNEERIAAGSESLRLGTGQHSNANFPQTLCNWPRQLGVILGQDSMPGFDDSYGGTHLGKGGSQLQPNVTRADHHKPCRYLGQCQGLSRRNHRTAEGKEREFNGSGPRGNDDLVGSNYLRANFRHNLDSLAVAKSCPPFDNLDPGRLQQPGNSAAQASDDAILPVHGLREVELGPGDGNTERGIVSCEARNLREFIGRVDQGLRRDATYVEAGSPWLLRLDYHCVNAKLPCPDRADIAARSCTDHQKLAGDVLQRLTLPRRSAPAFPAMS